MIVYLDDFLLMHMDPDILLTQTYFVVNQLTKLGECINQEKSVLQPTNRLKYLGLTWDTHRNTKSLTDDKIMKNLSII